MGFRKTRKSTTKTQAKRRSKKFTLENLEDRRMLVGYVGPVCGCGGPAHTGSSTANASLMSSSDFGSRIQSILGSPNSTYTSEAADAPWAPVRHAGLTFDGDTIEHSVTNPNGGIVLKANFTPDWDDAVTSMPTRAVLSTTTDDTWSKEITDLSHINQTSQFEIAAIARLADDPVWHRGNGSPYSFDSTYLVIEYFFDDGSGEVPAGVQSLSHETGFETFENRSDSVFGTGWSYEDYQFIYNPFDSNPSFSYWARPGRSPAYFVLGASGGVSAAEVPGYMEEVVANGERNLQYDDGFGTQWRFEPVSVGAGVTDPRYMLAERNDTNGNTTYFSYDDRNNDQVHDELVLITDELGRRTEFDYDEILVGGPVRLSQIVDVYDNQDRVTSFAYHDNGFLESIFEPVVYDGISGQQKSPTTIYQYAAGRLHTIEDPRGYVSEYVYDDNDRLTAMIDFDGSVIQQDSALGSMIGEFVAVSPLEAEVVNQRGFEETRTLNVFGNEIKLVDGLGNTSETHRNDLGLVSGNSQDVSIDGGVPTTVSTEMDFVSNSSASVRDGYLVNEIDHPGVGLIELDDFTSDTSLPQTIYDEMNRETRLNYVSGTSLVATETVVIGNYDLTTPGENDDLVTSYTYTNPTDDNLPFGLLETVTDPNDNTTTYEYYDNNSTASDLLTYGRLKKITHPTVNGVTDDVEFAYVVSALGTVVTITDELGRKSELHFDALDRLSKRLDPNPGAAIGTTPTTKTEYFYDLTGNLVGILDAEDNQTTYEYDGLGRMTKVIEADPDGNGPLLSPEWTYNYDAAGNLQSEQDPEGRLTAFHYDAANRRIATIDADVDGVIDNVHQNPASLGDVNADGKFDASDRALLEQLINEPGDSLPSLNAHGLPTVDLDLHGVSALSGPALTEMLVYVDIDDTGLSQGKLTIEDLYAWDAITVSAANTSIDGHPVTLYTFDPAGNMTSMTDPNGHLTQYQYNERSWLTKIIEPEAELGPTGLLDRPETTFVYDAVGQRTGMKDHLDRWTNWEYDDAGRLIAEVSPDIDGVMTYWQNEFSPFDIDGDGLVNSTGFSEGGDDYTLWRHLNDRDYLDPNDPNDDVFVNAVPEEYEDRVDVNGDGRFNQDDLDTWNNYFDDLNDANDTHGEIAETMYTGRPLTRYGYDKVGNVRFEIDPMYSVTEYQYDNRDRLTYVIGENPDERTSPFETVTVAPSLRLVRPVTEYQYDAASRLDKVIDPLQFVTDYDYDNLDRRSFTTLPDPDGNSGGNDQPVMEFGYDLVGNLTTIKDAESNITTYIYDDLYRLKQLIQPEVDLSSGVRDTPITDYFYNAASEQTSMSNPLGHVSNYEYDDLGRMTKEILPYHTTSSRPYTNYEYDLAGNLTKEQDAEGVLGGYWTEWEYDSLHRVTYERDKLNFMGATDLSETFYRYDAVGNRILLKDPEQHETSWSYNGLDRVDIETNRSLDRTYSYDLAGNQLELTDRLQRVTSYGYDNLHRRVGESWFNVGSGVSNRDFVYEYDLANRLKLSRDITGPNAATDFDFKHDYLYDNLGRLTDQDFAIGGFAETVSMGFKYDKSGNQTRIDATIGSSLDYSNVYGFDELDRLTSLTQQDSLLGSGGNEVADKLIEFDYDLAGQFDNIRRYAGLTTSSTAVAITKFVFDQSGRMLVKAHADGDTWSGKSVISAYVYSYDKANRMKSMLNPYSIDESVDTYTYDFRGQLEKADYRNDDFNEEYEYDANGNRTSADTEGGDYGYDIDDDNELESDGVFDYAYDDEGNRTARTKNDPNEPNDHSHTTFEWDHRNRLVRVSEYVDDNPATVAYQVVDYTYDDANQLLSRTVDHDIEGLATRFFVHQNGQIVLQFDGTDSTADLSHRYVWGPQVDQQLADEQLNLGYSESEVLWALSDHQGTVRDLAQYSDHANVEETIVWKHRRYDSFGILQAETNRGDFNGDGQLNLADVTILYDAVYDPQYSTYDVPDLNGDNVRDFADLEVMFEDILRTVVGDVYLDGTVSAAELNLVLNHWGQSVDWTLGDFDGDGFVGGGDLDVVLNGWGSNPNPLNTEVLDYAFGYTGRLFDEATGLQNNLNRWYDAKVGRWISEDPISFAGGDANLYRYVGNSPTNFTDPSGLAAFEATLAAFMTDLGIPEPSDLAPPKWAFWCGALAATGTLALMNSGENAELEAEKAQLLDQLAVDGMLLRSNEQWQRDDAQEGRTPDETIAKTCENLRRRIDTKLRRINKIDEQLK